MHILDRQTFVFSVDFNNFNGNTPSEIKTGVNLRFNADELILKSIVYNTRTGDPDTDDVIQIWCDQTDDNLLAAFPNGATVFQQHDEHFRISKKFQSGVIQFQFQNTDKPATFYYSPQPLLTDGLVGTAKTTTLGILSFTIEFVKLSKE